MKRAEIEAKIKETYGEEVDAKSLVDYIMAEYGRDVQAVRTASTKELLEAQQAKEAAETELKDYKEGGSKFVNQTEFERLRQFEQETLTAQKNEKIKAAVMKLLEDNKANATVKELLVNGIDFNTVKMKDDGTIENGEEIIKPLKEHYPTCFTSVQNKNANPAAPTPGQGGDGNGNGNVFDIASALKEKYHN